MNSKSSWQRYLSRTTGGFTQAKVAERLGYTESKVSRWFSGKNVATAEDVIAVARAFNDDPKMALVETGFLTYAEVSGDMEELSVEHALKRATELQLAQETINRIKAGSATGQTTEPIQLDKNANVVPFRKTGTLPEGFDPEAELPHAAYDDTEEPGLPEEP